jgi:hypothetical protein
MTGSADASFDRLAEEQLRRQLYEVDELMAEAREALLGHPDLAEVRRALEEVQLGLSAAQGDPLSTAGALPDLDRSVRSAGRLLHRKLRGA